MRCGPGREHAAHHLVGDLGRGDIDDAGEQARIHELLHRLAADAGGVEHEAVVVAPRAPCVTACTHGVVTPNIVRPMAGLVTAWLGGGCAIMPASACAAFASTCSLDAVDARTSVTEYIMQMSLGPT